MKGEVLHHTDSIYPTRHCLKAAICDGEGGDHTEVNLHTLDLLGVSQVPAEEPTCGETSVEQQLVWWKVRVEPTVPEVLQLCVKYWLGKSHNFTVSGPSHCGTLSECAAPALLSLILLSMLNIPIPTEQCFQIFPNIERLAYYLGTFKHCLHILFLLITINGSCRPPTSGKVGCRSRLNKLNNLLTKIVEFSSLHPQLDNKVCKLLS